MARQLELLPLKLQSAEQRKAWITERLHGLEFRQAARAERRRRERERRAAQPQDPAECQLTIAALLDRGD